MTETTSLTPPGIDVERAIERQIAERTWGRVRQLRVELDAGRVIIHGSVPSYYLKQLALEAARQVLAGTGTAALVVAIQVQDGTLPPLGAKADEVSDVH